jgi:hypothetical protein
MHKSVFWNWEWDRSDLEYIGEEQYMKRELENIKELRRKDEVDERVRENLEEYAGSCELMCAPAVFFIKSSWSRIDNRVVFRDRLLDVWRTQVRSLTCRLMAIQPWPWSKPWIWICNGFLIVETIAE